MPCRSSAQPETNERVSRLEHPFNAGVHFILFDELAASDLVNAYLDLLLEPLGVGEKTCDCFLDKFVGSPSSSGRKFV